MPTIKRISVLPFCVARTVSFSILRSKPSPQVTDYLLEEHLFNLWTDTRASTYDIIFCAAVNSSTVDDECCYLLAPILSCPRASFQTQLLIEDLGGKNLYCGSAAQSQLYRELWTLTYSTKQLVT